MADLVESVVPVRIGYGKCIAGIEWTALGWARKLASQAPVAIEQIKTVSAKGDLDEGIAAEKQGFAKVFASEDAREGISAFLQKRKARFQGK